MNNDAKLSPFCKRLWKAGLFLLAIYLSFICVGWWQGRTSDTRSMGHDFIGFYAASQFAQTGDIAANYDPTRQLAAAEAIVKSQQLDIKLKYGAWLYPPFVNLILRPLASFSFGDALNIWTALGLLACAASIAQMRRMLPPETHWTRWGLLPLLILVSMPCALNLGHGQNAFFSLLIITTTVTLWRKSVKRDDGHLTRRNDLVNLTPRTAAYLAGMVAGLLFYKPQLGAVVALLLVISVGWRALAGLIVTGVLLVLLSISISPEALPAYIHAISSQVEWMQANGHFPWSRHVTSLAFFHRLLGPVEHLPTLFTRCLAGIVSVGLLIALLTAAIRNRHHAAMQDRIIVVTLLSTPLIVPYFVDYDLILLAIPMTLFARERLAPVHIKDVVTLPRMARFDAARYGWVALYLATLIGTVVAGQTRLSLVVPVLMAMTIARIQPLVRRTVASSRLTDSPVALQYLAKAA